jgi:pimeloyl-ACP methyl ester carboxylesterase
MRFRCHQTCGPMMLFLKYAALFGLVCFPIQSGANHSTISPQTAYLRPANQTGPYKKRVIVFVHGLFGNFDGTWRFSPQVYWPQLLLSDATFNDSDIYVASYASPFADGRMNIEDIVSNLDNRLKADNVFSKHREVMFVCHSLGGLIVEKLLLKNRDYSSNVSAGHK